MNRNLQSVAEFATNSPFTEPQLRWWLHNGKSNGLETAGAVARIGRRVYIDVEGFERWIDAQNQRVAA